MKYKVLEYNSHNNAHRCQDENGIRFFIDLMVSSDLEVDDEKYDEYIQELIGKSVEIEELTHYVAIGNGIRLIDEG